MEGIHYIEKQGNYKKSESNTCNINNEFSNSPKAQVIQFSDYSSQNISNVDNNNNKTFEEIEEIKNQIVEFKNELLEIEKKLTESIDKKDKSIFQKFFSSKSFKYIKPGLNLDFSLDKLAGYFGLS